jgi:hypothetical protein
MIKGFPSLKQEQIDLILKYREDAQVLTAELFQGLVKLETQDISLLVLSETAGLSADVIALTTSIGNNKENLEANKCSDIDQFTELLFLYAINRMIIDVKTMLNVSLTVSSSNKSEPSNIDHAFIESLLKESNKSIKH